MLEFRVKNIVPPGGAYFYEVDGRSLQAATRSGLMSQIHAAYASLGQPVPADIGARVEDFMCRRLPVAFCTGPDDGLPRARVVTIQGLKQDTDRLIAQSPALAPPTLVRFRATTCNSCGKNNRSMCPSCSGINAWAARRVGRPDTPALFNWLGVCACDGIALAAKVHLTELPHNDEYPETCWVISEGAQDA